ncbi:MAG: inositol monophosphatase [Duodenibacillus sp.]|nr:inositol monophosphatase [Duodenibacillus sp.]
MVRHTYTAPMSEKEKQAFVPFLHELIDCALGEILPRFLTGIEVDDKSNGTPVTQADKMAEWRMRQLIEARFPSHGIFGEEWGEKPAQAEAVRYRWILDPIDGTRSFITNSFLFGTLIALERDDGEGFRPILSTITHPAAGVRAIGSRDETVLHVENRFGRTQRTVKVRDCGELSRASLLVTSHWTTPEQCGDERLQRLIDEVKLYRTMGDCFGYFAVATGGADIMIDPELCYWDVAALLPVVEGAGGVISSMKGGNPLEELSAVCTAGAIHQQVLDRLNL